MSINCRLAKLFECEGTNIVNVAFILKEMRESIDEMEAGDFKGRHMNL